jgi:hypothetical protein
VGLPLLRAAAQHAGRRRPEQRHPGAVATRSRAHNVLSRFKFETTSSSGRRAEDPGSPADRGQCCHAGGDIGFDKDGNLFLSTGDDTNPFASSGYTPIDDQPAATRTYDAQRSSGNTNDLRGKLLRIKVGEDGKYTIPAGNLFAPGTMSTKPEIYAMGFRNPFRFSVDKRTGYVYLGEYGPEPAPLPRPGAPAGRSSSTSSRARATTAGPSATAPTTPTTTTTSPPGSPARSSPAPRRSTTPPTTPA